MKNFLLSSIMFLVWIVPSFAQHTVKGQIMDKTGEPVNGVLVEVLDSEKNTMTDGEGYFTITDISQNEVTLKFSLEQWNIFFTDVSFTSENPTQDLGKVTLLRKTDMANIPIITLSESEVEQEDGFENISGLLSAGRDPFAQAAAFNFGVARFKMRGYQNNSTQTFINGSNMNDLETGGTYWSAWGGLNDVLRSRDVAIGLEASEFGFGGVNGGLNIDTRASSQWKQTRVSYASSNRSYRHRLMGVYTPKLKNDWHLTLSGSRRWAQEGYVEGTFYDSWAYFLGVEKKIANHSISLTAFGSPTKRGKQGAAVQEMYDIAGTNYYNPHWGFQNGKKRNSRVSNAHQPVAILSHQWELNETSKLTTSLSFQAGRNGGTALNWFDARDPRPDYYRYLPSYSENDENAAMIYDALANDQTLRQLDFDGFYQVNWAAKPETIEDANGIVGNSVTGQRAKYFIEDRRYDKKRADANVLYNTAIGDNITIQAGGFYRWQKTRNHKVVEDLLGADFHVDVDQFAERDLPDNPVALQNDLLIPNRIIREGDSFGYDYDSNIREAGAWGQGQISLNKIDIFVAGSIAQTQFWRTGRYQNGRFPNNSLGNSEKQNFLNFGVKGGATYKIDGRNYLFVNGAYMHRPPSYRDSYVSPRTRDEVAPGLTTEKIASTEGGYALNSPLLKLRITGYFTNFQDGINTLSFYNDRERAFVNYTVNGIDRQHFGLEAAGEVQIVAGLSAKAAVAIGQYTYTNRPTSFLTLDNTAAPISSGSTVYQKNFYVPNTPQQAYTAGLSYRSSKFWFANVSFNFFNEMYMDFNPDRRTAAGVADVQYQSEDWYTAINQERLDPQYTIDLFGGKSFKFKDYFLYLTVGVSNITNNRQFRTGGYEQLRFTGEDVDQFPSKYYYAYGTNYFASLALRF